MGFTGDTLALPGEVRRRPLHIKAGPGDVARSVIVVGDPGRARLLASMLNDARIVNDHRGLLVYTGLWRGKPVSVAVHGIGGPSALIVFEELYMLGAKVMIRLGTCGGIKTSLRLGDIVVVPGAAYYCGGAGLSGYSEPGSCLPAVADPLLTLRLKEAIEERIRGSGASVVAAPVVTSDSFYAESEGFRDYWDKRGVAAVEMECASLLALSWIRGFKAGCVLIVSDLLFNGFPHIDSGLLEDRVRAVAPAVLDVAVDL